MIAESSSDCEPMFRAFPTPTPSDSWPSSRTRAAAWPRARVERGLKPGGIVVVESFHEDAARDHRIGGSVCRAGELPALFKNLRVVHYAEPMAMPDFGTERMRVVRFAAEKPVR
jgi:hypothetical protein